MSTPFAPGPRIMGIVNVTPDSFSDGGRYTDRAGAVAHALRLADEGADIIDIGGESTRPPGVDYGRGAGRVGAQEEIDRVVPVIADVHAALPEMMISVDTMKPEVALAAVGAGARMINDVSAGRYDPGIWNVAAESGAPCVVMHGHDPHHPSAVGQTHYDDVVGTVFDFLRERIDAARAAGVANVLADVGIGFAKGAADNERLLREHHRFLDLGVPLVVGASRKAFIGRALGGAAPEDRLSGTLAANAIAVLNGASILRVHDVRATREFFIMFQRLLAPTPV